MHRRRTSINVVLATATLAVVASVVMAGFVPRLEKRGVVGHLLCAVDGRYIDEADAYDPYTASLLAIESDLVTSQQVVHTALRSPRAGSLPLVTELADPAAWIRERLSARFVRAGVLEVSLQDPQASLDALGVILQTVLDAYEDDSTLRHKLLRQQQCDAILHGHRDATRAIKSWGATSAAPDIDTHLEQLMEVQAQLAKLIDQEVNVEWHLRGSCSFGSVEPTGIEASFRRLARRLSLVAE